MRGTKAKLFRKLAKASAENKDTTYTAINHRVKDYPIGFNADGTQRMVKMETFTAVMEDGCARKLYKQVKGA